MQSAITCYKAVISMPMPYGQVVYNFWEMMSYTEAARYT